MAGFYDDYTDGGSGEQSSSFYGTDKEYSEAAALSAQSASNSATAASASATSAAASATTASSAASGVAADAAAAEAAKLAAQAAQAAAELAETGAETAETNAETAETNAASSASAASTSATNAANSASSAATSASNASTSASAAATSATDASTSASSAATSATSAATSAGTATTQATAAAASATSASNSATAAASSASAASTSATNAATSETNAATSAANASTSETNASASETAAAGSATSASTSASNAATSATSASNSASAASTSATNAAASETNAATSETNAAASASAASTSATNAAASESAAATSATSAATSASTATTQAGLASTSASNAATSETNAATSASNAASSATTAASSASSASTSASNAATSATNAAASETAAAGSASAASASADAALAALDSFDDRYLGQKASAPTVDNDGDPLVTGALYFDTVDDAMKVWDGTQWLNAYASLSGALIATNNLSDLTNAATARTNLGLGTAATTDSTAYATAAQGALADAALPASSYTAADVLTKVKTVDGSGSGLDADLLDGNHASAFATAAQGALADSALQSYTETDPTVPSHVKAITTTNITNWNAAYGWGDHALAGYLTSYTETDPVYTASSWYTTTNNSGNWNTAYGWGDHSLAGYLTGNQAITLSGDVSGSGTTSIVVTVADDSHNHIIANVDGLQAALDGKVDDSQVLTNVPSGAVFTDTTYSVGNGGLTEINFTSALNSKLAGIEAGATADQTAAEILTAIKTVDGSGSGLDADLLDGQQGSYYVNTSTAQTISGIKSFNSETKFGSSYVDPDTGVARDAKFGDNGIAVRGGIKADGLSLGDNNAATFGASNDMQLFHNGSHSYLQDNGTGNLFIQGQQTVISGYSSGNWNAQFVDNGDSIFYHSTNGEKARVNSTGIDVTGTVTADALNVSGTLAISGSTGTSGQVLTSNGASAPSWQTPSSGGITTGKAIAMAMVFG